MNRKEIKKRVSVRKSKLKQLYTVIENHSDEIAEALNTDFGKPRFESYAAEISFILSEIRNIIKHLGRWSTPQQTSSPLAMWPAKSYIVPAALGDVLVFAPWNYPFQLSMGPAISAWAAGNRVVLKPSAQTAETAKMIQKVVGEVFESDEFEVVLGGRELSDSLLEEKWDLIFFTGSPRIGKMIAEKAASRLTPVVLELGGKSPCIVAPEADLELTARRIVWGKFLNAGQTCVAPDYILAHRSIEKPLIEALKQEIEKQYGDLAAYPMPSIINRANYERLKGMIEESRLLFGGDTDDEKRVITPAILRPDGWDSAVMQQEIFGPLLPVLTWDEESQLDEHIAHSPQPLALYYFGSPKLAAPVMDRIQFGGGCVNDVVMHLVNDHLPFGGVGQSGYGNYHGKFGFDTFTHRKGVVVRGAVDPRVRYRKHSLADLKLTRLLMEKG